MASAARDVSPTRDVDRDEAVSRVTRPSTMDMHKRLGLQSHTMWGIRFRSPCNSPTTNGRHHRIPTYSYSCTLNLECTEGSTARQAPHTMRRGHSAARSSRDRLRRRQGRRHCREACRSRQHQPWEPSIRYGHRNGPNPRATNSTNDPTPNSTVTSWVLHGAHLR